MKTPRTEAVTPEKGMENAQKDIGCGCPHSVVSQNESHVVFLGLNNKEKYFSLVARNYDQAFFAVPPGSMKPSIFNAKDEGFEDDDDGTEDDASRDSDSEIVCLNPMDVTAEAAKDTPSSSCKVKYDKTGILDKVQLDVGIKAEKVCLSLEPKVRNRRERRLT